MALPAQIDSSVPVGSESPSLGDDRIRAFKLAVVDIFGLPDATNISTAVMSVASTGLTTVIFRDSAADPASAGRLQRNGTEIMWHDGSAPRALVYTDGFQAIDNKNLTGIGSIIFSDQSSDALVLGQVLLNGTRLSYHDGAQARSLNGTVHFNGTGVGNVGGGEDFLMSYMFPANTFATGSRTARITATGIFNNNANVKTLKFFWGATYAVTLNTTAAPNFHLWRATILISAVGVNQQRISVDYVSAQNSTTVGDVYLNTSGFGTDTTSGAINAFFTGQSGASVTDDVQQYSLLVEMLN